MRDCEHSAILIVTETPQDIKSVQPVKQWVECADCHEVLPITSITRDDRTVPLIEIPK